MNKLTNEEIARVFAMYYGCGITHNKNYTIEVINSYMFFSEIILKYKLLLTPLSAITDEHAIEVGKMEIPEGGLEYLSHDKKTITFGRYGNDGWMNEYVFFDDINNFQHQYLIQQGYAVPLWFGVNHWANGKTAIELEIAIDKTKITINSKV